MVEDHDPNVDLSVSFPVQQGLKFQVWLNLQNGDELHFCVEHLWLQCFPCTKAERVAAYVDTVSDFLSGRARVLERYRGRRCVSAELQVPDGQAWRTIDKSSRLSLPFPRAVTYREVRNA